MNWIQHSAEVVRGQLRFEVKTWSGFHDVITLPVLQKATRGFVWRGHRSASWKLRSTLQRQLDRITTTTAELEEPENRRIFVNSVVRMFKNACRGRRGPNPRTLGMGETEFWAIGQHYGLATPLLDWTLSPYAAAYFAYRHFDPTLDPNDHPVVWGLDRNAVEYDNRLIPDEALTFIEPTGDDNPRLVSQGGLFTQVPLDVSVEDWVSQRERSNKYPYLIRIDLPAGHRIEAMMSLQSMNVTPLSLFPDLEGAALAINQIVELSPLQVLRHSRWQPVTDE